MAEARAWVMIPKSDKKATEIILDMHPLVLCKDCKHWDRGHSEECDNSDSVCFHNGWCKPEWFCADGERKETIIAEVDEKFMGDL